jgi:hypothetical protein
MPADNAVKVAYMIMVDRERAGRESECRHPSNILLLISALRSDACGPKA